MYQTGQETYANWKITTEWILLLYLHLFVSASAKLVALAGGVVPLREGFELEKSHKVAALYPQGTFHGVVRHMWLKHVGTIETCWNVDIEMALHLVSSLTVSVYLPFCWSFRDSSPSRLRNTSTASGLASTSSTPLGMEGFGLTEF